jgi:hypothetical protein
MTGIGINRKAKLLGMDAPGKSEDVSLPKPPPSAEEGAIRTFADPRENTPGNVVVVRAK